jgi:hypothetical protein
MVHLFVFIAHIVLIAVSQLLGDYWTVQDRIASYVIIGFTLTLSLLAKIYESTKDKEE